MFLFCNLYCYSQSNRGELLQQLPNNLNFNSSKIVRTDSGVYILQYAKANCKGYIYESTFYPNSSVPIAFQKVSVIKPEPRRVKFLTIHGNISYEYFYRSAIDTPITQNNFQQHTERVALDIMIKEKYPLKLLLVSRQSNSPYFRNFIDPIFQFDKYAFNKNFKQDLINKLNAQLPQRPDMKLLAAALKEQSNRLNGLKNWLESPSILQKIIEERERRYYQNISNQTNTQPNNLRSSKSNDIAASMEGKLKDSMLTKGTFYKKGIDSSVNNFAILYEKKKSEYDSLIKQIQSLEKRVDSIKGKVQSEILIAKQKIYKATSERDLNKIAAENGVRLDAKDKLDRKLMAIKNFSVGRTILNYTELTAQNITLTGVNVEYNPSYYAAFAAGKLDYQFRDYFNKNAKQNGQYLILGRFGIGDKDKRAVIFTIFQGRKNQADFALPDSISNHVDIMGYSLEAIIKKDANTSLSAEFAKSTKPVSGNLQTTKQTASLVRFNDQTNMGINFKGQTIIPETNTRVSGFYRKTGENFQSFSLFSYNTNQTAWLTRLDQSLFKSKVMISGMVRQNDFANPFTEKTYKTTTVFKSVLLNVRFPKYPALSFGYYPGTQLYFIDKDRIRENAYYIINGSLVYSYYFKNIGMNTLLNFNRYLNQATDSGFVLYKGTNYYASQTVFLHKLQLQGGYAYTRQPELEYYTIESSGDYSIMKWFKVGVGAKYNQISGGNQYWGGRAMLTAEFKRLGGLQFQYEKSYLPTINKTLYPVEIGRVSWYKYF